jgi:hypothetical protein
VIAVGAIIYVLVPRPARTAGLPPEITAESASDGALATEVIPDNSDRDET